MAKLSRSILTAACFMCLIITAIVTNPTQEQFSNYSKDQLSEQLNPGQNAVGDALISVIGKPILTEMTTATDYVLFSLYEINVGSDETLKFLGAFNHFLPLNLPDSITETIESL